MRLDAPPRPRRAAIYLAIGVVATVVSLVLVLDGRAGTLAWMGFGSGIACLLVGAAQRSSARHGGPGHAAGATVESEVP